VFGVDFTSVSGTHRVDAAPAFVEAAELSRIRTIMLGN
jgi:hypothetical protein